MDVRLATADSCVMLVDVKRDELEPIMAHMKRFPFKLSDLCNSIMRDARDGGMEKSD